MHYKNIVLFGAPGTGKGSYGRLIQKEFKIPVFSLGDYLRKLTSGALGHGGHLMHWKWLELF